MIPILKILIGLSGSGKSTWAKNFISKNDNWCIVSRDDLRHAWQNRGVVEIKLEGIISDIVEHTIQTLIQAKYNVVYDATNVKRSEIYEIAAIVKHTARVEFQIFDVPKKTAIERDSQRKNPVGELIINRQYEQYLILLDSFDFQPINPIPKRYIAPKFDQNKKKCIIVDIDGTLAHASGKRDWYDYDKVDSDDLDLVLNSLLVQIETGLFKYDIILLSGRDEICREQTEQWLKKYKLNFDQLLMRKSGDDRKDAIIKEEIFWNEIDPNYNVLCVFDDRDQVVKMWRSLGIKCLQVEYGNF